MSSPPKSCDRRSFLLRTAALLGAGVTAACENSPLSPLVSGEDGAFSVHATDTLHVFANESGEFAGRDPFVVGLLLTDAPEAHSGALADLRTSLGYFIELRYGNTDRYKEDYAEAALDHFFDSDGLRFAAVATNASRSAGGVDATGLYEELLGQLGGSAALRMERRFFDPDPDADLKARLEGGSGASVEFVPSHDSELLQLGDLLTGSVRGDMARKAKGRSNPRRPGSRGGSGRGRRGRGGRGGSRGRGRPPAPGGNVKDRLIASLKRRLDVRRLIHPSLARSEKFNVQVLHPPF